MQGGVDDWNDFRVVLAISRAGRLTEAAKALGVDHSTAFRRLQTIEGRFGQPLFERLAGGAYAATEAGAAMVAVAERIEDEVMAVARDLAGRDHSLSGRLRLTSSETLAYRLLTRHIAAFRAAHPGVVVELSIENRVLDLSRREADVALRPMRPRQKDLWGRKLADVAWCLYRAAGGGEPGMQAVIGWDPGAADIGAADWLAANVPAAAIVFRTSSLINQMTAARAGMGVALLPCYLGDGEPGLVRAVAEPLGDMRSELWIVTHVDLRRTARVRAFFDVVIEGIAGDRGLIEGKVSARRAG